MSLTITIEPTFQAKLEQIAQSTGKSPEEIVNEAIQEHLERLNEQRLEAEIRAFKQMHANLKTSYFGQFVAVYEGQVVDSVSDFESLFLRVQARFGDAPVLIGQVTNSPIEEWHFRSPRLEHI
jgi:predicted transcriptional regulator